MNEETKRLREKLREIYGIDTALMQDREVINIAFEKIDEAHKIAESIYSMVIEVLDNDEYQQEGSGEVAKG